MNDKQAKDAKQQADKLLLNTRMKKQLINILGRALRFYKYDIDALLAMSDDELERTMLDYLARYACEKMSNTKTKTGE